MTLSRHILECQRRQPDATGELAVLLTQLAFAGKVFAHELRRAALVGDLGATGATNVQGEATRKLDVFGNQTIIEAFAHAEIVAAIVSEEEDEPRQIASGAKASYLLCVDPLDGSSNSDTNGVVGTIFGVYRSGQPSEARGVRSGLPGTGREQVAAGYIMYGPSTVFVYTTGDGVNGFTLDGDIGEFLLTHPDIRCPAEGRYYAVNLAAAREWPAATQAYLDSLGDPTGRSRGYSQRYSGALVADVHRALLEGGTYFYPPDRGHPDGKLRLLYECAPLAFVVEQAGGRATTGETCVLDVRIETIHQRAPLAIGSRVEIERYEQFLNTRCDCATRS
ncbi:MAG: class 1 fructose-bisphosphatase [Acidobacteria bacterium]|nr:class 1 fructose-bisphosphatase [Acidobacteriota bacterium]